MSVWLGPLFHGWVCLRLLIGKMSKSNKTREKDNSSQDNAYGSMQICGALLCVLGMFFLLSLLSYDLRDVSELSSPPSEVTSNLIGPLGVWVAYKTFMWFGLAAWVLPFWSILLGLGLLTGRGRRWRTLFWGILFTLSLTCVLQLPSVLFARTLESLNLTDAGGHIGWLGMTAFLERWLSPVGGGLVAWGILLISSVFLLGLDSLRATHRAVGKVVAHVSVAFSEWQDEIERRREEAAESVRQTRSEREREERAAADKLKEQEKAERDQERELRQKQRVAEQERKRNDAAARRDAFDRRHQDEMRQQEERRRVAEASSLQQAPSQPAAPVTLDPADETPYVLPPVDLLDPIPADALTSASGGDTEATAVLLVDTLREFGLEVKVTNVEVGPVVTRYELLPAPGIRVERIARLSNNIALVLKATSVRVQAPIPGKGVVGIEVPNDVSRIVTGREIIESKAWTESKDAVPLVLGKDVGGQDIIADLAKMPHLLIAGATGSGKSVCMNSVLAGLLMSRTPDQLRLMLVDPKIVEFSVYNHLPHLVVPVITDPAKVALGLRWAINEMEKRYKLFAKEGVRNISSFNDREIATQQDMFGEESTAAGPQVPKTLPYIVIIIDELADLMLSAGAEIENSIARLAQLSRAVGIHMILATQRPSVNVITGTIKANFPARIAFQVAQKVDSRTILDSQGAETLLGRGDMLFAPPSSSKLIRAQGALVNDAEVSRLVEFVKKQKEPSYVREIKDTLDNVAAGTTSSSSSGSDSLSNADDELLEKSIQIIRETRRASTSMLQRRLRVGYTRAARLMDELEARAIIGAPRGSEPREILIDLDGEIPDNAGDVDLDVNDDDSDAPEELP